MKKRTKLSIFMIALGIIGLIVSLFLGENYYKENNSTPDSGNDFSYDGGGSDYGGGSGGSSSDYGGSGEGDAIAMIVFFGGIGIFIAAVLLWDYHNGKKYQQEIAETKNKLINLGYDPDELCKQAFYVYVNVQYAWMNFDYKTLRYFLNDELYNNYVELLEQKKLHGEKNIMEDITEGKNNHIRSFELVDGKLIMTMVISVHQKDYIINNEGMLVRGDKLIHDVTYEITYELSKNETNICPNCGAKLSRASSEICSYCGSVVMNKNHGLVMVKKQIMYQS